MQDVLDFHLISSDSHTLSVAHLLITTLIWLITALLLFAVKKSIYRIHRIDVSKKYSIYVLIKYFSFVLAAVFSLQTLGFNLSVLLAGSAALLVGLGLGIQNLFNDFISGIIILFDSSIKIGDIIETNGLICKVIDINLRTTTVLARDDKYIILPNSDLTRNQLINWTHHQVDSRFDINVGVSYTSDVSKVMELITQAAVENKDVLENPAPFVRLSNFGESSLDFELLFYTNEVFRVEKTKSYLRIRIFELFKEHHIEIPFPQRVIHQNQST